jgi:hypothetical protein
MGTPTAENKILVRRFEEAMNTRQLDALDEVVAPNFVRCKRRRENPSLKRPDRPVAPE